MSGQASLLNGLQFGASAWAVRECHACLWGGLFALGVGAMCRLAPRLPAPLRAWLWWLACLKLTLDLCWAAPLALPVLPARVVRLAPVAVRVIAAPAPGGGYKAAAEAAVPPVFLASLPSAPLPPSPMTLPLGLMLAWLGGVLWQAVRLGRQAVALRRSVRASRPATLPTLDLTALGAALKLRRVPRVLESTAVAAPCIVGGLRPMILLPVGMAAVLTPDELRLALAHEMAHARRGDLLLAWLPTLTRALFFFHPLVWWAGAEWAMAREEACDALALRATGASTASYGRLLLRMAGGGKQPAPALSLSPGYHGLRRRLVGLARAGQGGRARLGWILAAALPLLIPWRLTTAEASRLSGPLTASTDAAPLKYGITDLGDAGGVTDAVALDDAGEVAGTAWGAGQAAQGVLWSGRGVDLGALPKQHFSLASGLSGDGRAAGTSFNIPGRGRAFVWDGTPHRVGSLPGYPYSEARGVNRAGQVVGIAETGGHDRWRAQIARAFVWQDGDISDLGTLGGPYSAAYGVNDGGVVVGKSDTATFGQTHAFAWADGRMQDLGTLGGANSLACRVNGRGQIAGYSETGPGETRHAFLWAEGQMRDLGTLPGLADSAAADVSDAGDAVGYASPAPDSPARRAVLWHDGQIVDLNNLLPPGSGWLLTEARAVNARGQIAGVGLAGGHPRAFLLTPR